MCVHTVEEVALYITIDEINRKCYITSQSCQPLSSVVPTPLQKKLYHVDCRVLGNIKNVTGVCNRNPSCKVFVK